MLPFGLQLLLALLGGPLLGLLVAKALGIPLPAMPQDWRTIKPVEHAPEPIRINSNWGVNSCMTNYTACFSTSSSWSQLSPTEPK